MIILEPLLPLFTILLLFLMNFAIFIAFFLVYAISLMASLIADAAEHLLPIFLSSSLSQGLIDHPMISLLLTVLFSGTF